MISSMSQLFEKGSQEQIMSALKIALNHTNEPPFWTEKILPYTEALLSVLIPLREQNLLFTPENKPVTALSTDLFLSWCDLMSAKTLAFTLQESNTKGSLERVQIEKEHANTYKAIDLESLGKYLDYNAINLNNEWDDFPVAKYNLHRGIGDILKKLVH